MSSLPKPLHPPPQLQTAPSIPDYIDSKDPLAIGIHYHEVSQFELSAYYFSIAAARGDATGLFLYAISMRHGWGCEKNEEEAFRLVPFH
jgi:TPR repeat protein